MKNLLKGIADIEISRSEELSRLVAGLQPDGHKEISTIKWTHEFAASGKTCQVVGVHEPIWTAKLASCDKSGKVT